MSQTKAQLLAPVGIVTTQGVVVTGVMTATSFDGDVVGSATSIISGSNLNLGIVTATASIGFGGDFTGTATGIQTGAAIKVGVFTATSFTGDFTGTATSMMRGTGFEAGTVTSTAANVTYTITVGSKTGGGNAFYIDGVEAPVITLYPGATYTFDQADSTNGDHPLRLATAADAAGSTEYTDGVTVNGTQGTAGAYTRIVVARNAPTPLYYYCTAHSGMGNSINITNQLQGNVTGNVTGSITGLAGSVSSGGNIHVGVMTATSYSGDGSNLTGIAATNFNTQTVTANTSETIIDLADGNCITMKQTSDTTVGFASTSTAMDVTLIREKIDSFASGGVEFDGTGDYLGTTSSSSDLSMGTGDFTIEMWVKYNSISNEGLFQISTTSGGLATGSSLSLQVVSNDGGAYGVYFNNSQNGTSAPGTCNNKAINTGQWYHLALTRSGTTSRFYVDGVCQVYGNDCTNDSSKTDSTDYNGTYVCIGGFYDTSFLLDGTISNFRIVKGTALYTGLDSFDPPIRELTNITNTKFLACQSTSSTTAATVIPSGTITANGDPTAGAETIQLGSPLPYSITWPSSVKWNGGTAPTLISTATTTSERQQFQFVTGDTGLNWYAWEPFINDPLNLELFSWGSNANQGQLGQNNRTDLSSPTQIGTEGKWQTASGHANGQGGIKSNGTMWAWGENATGELGQNDKTLRSSPVQVGTNKNWKSLQWGNSTCWALTDGGTMYAWGINPAGQFGSGDVISRSSPIQIGESGIWSSVQQAGNGTGAAVKKAGGLWRWGANNNGELGMNSRTYYSSPIQIGSGTWKSFGGGKDFNVGVSDSGQLFTMGRNNVGQLGLNEGGPSARQSSPTQVGSGTDWASATGGKYWAAALKTDGSLYAWGVNNNGNLGQNSRLPSDNTGISSPVQIPGTWSHIRGNNGGFIGGKADGTMWVWGYNNPGILGLNSTYPSDPGRSSPTQLPGTWNVANISFYSEAGCILGLKEP